MDRHIVKHGDGVRDVAFQVEDCNAIYKVSSFDFRTKKKILENVIFISQKCMSKGAVSVSGPKELKDENGTVIMASIRTVNFLKINQL
jgi:4-hydroxyphenylpyruvate dioxygenase